MTMLKKQSLVDQIYEQIRMEIINLSMPLGSRVNVSELQERYAVSSTPIREAINRLQNEGLVTYENNVGARVVAVTPDDVREIHELAMTLHSAAIRFAMARGDRDVILEGLQKQLEHYRKAVDFEERTKSVYEFMGVFYRNCGNSRIDTSMKVIQGLQLILRNVYGHSRYGTGPIGDDPGNTADFQEMYDAAKAGDTARIIAALEANVRRAEPLIMEAVREMPME